MIETAHNRRSILKRALVFVGGAAGIGAVAKDAHGQIGMGLPAAGSRTVSLYGRNWLLETPNRRPGEAIQAGDHGVVSGELLDGPKGKVVGQFYASRLAFVAAPNAKANAGVEVHTFVLKGGTIVGMGTSLMGDEAVFAVVGGTGAYAGAKGSYAATQRLREQGGNGTAEFKLTLRS